MNTGIKLTPEDLNKAVEDVSDWGYGITRLLEWLICDSHKPREEWDGYILNKVTEKITHDDRLSRYGLAVFFADEIKPVLNIYIEQGRIDRALAAADEVWNARHTPRYTATVEKYTIPE